ncbi:MAG: MoaD/ThiS family protein [Candidatus Heimdallarchaeota archaeon]|nr:MoaD/ThiS family protein [Candidatus Heimdallarchaeota archaeon]MCK4770916.1 MoaD/ThiS family protein [Candidatus Heimdallarchaeota archaeon]
MNIFIHCFGQVRTITKEAKVSIDVPSGSSVTQAIDIFVKKFGEELERLLYREEKLRDFYSIQIDRNNVRNDELSDTKIETNQTISIIPFVSGG